MPLRDWLQLSLTRGLGPILIGRLVEAAGSAEAACAASATLLRTIDGIARLKGDAIARSLRDAADAVQAELDRAAALNVTIISPDDDWYPVLLKSTPDPPAVLYARGDLQPRDLNAVAIVGSRKCSVYGREQADRFGALLAGAGVTVLSGGARGIDSAAHRGAMTHPHGRTIAVLGSGVDVAYPPENDGLFRQIAGGRGAVLSEYPLGTPPTPENFPRRNRIVSGMSRGVLVIEADVRSGALITARQACDDHGRPVFAMPGRVDNPLAQGTHQLIRDGAMLAANLEDILDGLGPLPADAVEPSIGPPVIAPTLFGPVPVIARSSDANPGLPAGASTGNGGLSGSASTVARPESAAAPAPAREAKPADEGVGLSERQRAILAAIGSDAANVDALIDRTGLPAQAILQELTLLTLRGQVRRVDGQTYARRT